MKLKLIHMGGCYCDIEVDELVAILPGDEPGTKAVAVIENGEEIVYSDLEEVQVIKKEVA